MKNKFLRFMIGRYGPDELYQFLFGLYIALFFLNLLIGNKIITILEFLIVWILFYRFFSKKITKRRKENQTYIKLKNKVMNQFIKIKRKLFDKEHIYKKCLKCKTTLKLPLPMKRGIKHAKCPKCKNNVTVFTLKKQKIEIIKTKKG